MLPSLILTVILITPSHFLMFFHFNISRNIFVKISTKRLALAGTVPIIRSPKGNAAEMVAQKLDKKLRENLFDARNNLFLTDAQSRNFNFQRPLLIILDRNVDMATPLHHTWTYQALAHDLLDLALNRVVIEESVSSGGK